MGNMGQSRKEDPSTDRRGFLRRFFRKSAPLVVGAVAQPLAKLPGIGPAEAQPRKSGESSIPSPGTVSEELKKEFDENHEEFLRENPDFFELP